MNPIARRALACVAVPAAALAAGCQHQPRVVIRDLPVDAIAEAAPRPAAARPTRTRPEERKPAPAPRRRKPRPRAVVPAAWLHQGVLPRPWRWIVIHHSATDRGSAEIFDRAHRARGWDELGYHFVIDNGNGGRDGKIEVGSRWTKQKWGAHCKTPDNAYNDYGIGVCVVGRYTDRLPSADQLGSLQKLVTYLSLKYDIAATAVIGHRDAPGTATECPGDALHAYIHKALRPRLAAVRRKAGQ